ncbi:hypothetical protein R80B4_03294 [Fibrobacteres bacterium R8-0-B4]
MGITEVKCCEKSLAPTPHRLGAGIGRGQCGAGGGDRVVSRCPEPRQNVCSRNTCANGRAWTRRRGGIYATLSRKTGTRFRKMAKRTTLPLLGIHNLPPDVPIGPHHGGIDGGVRLLTRCDKNGANTAVNRAFGVAAGIYLYFPRFAGVYVFPVFRGQFMTSFLKRRCRLLYI